MVSLDSTGTSPGGMRRGSTLPPSERPSTSSSSATQRTMTLGYGSTSNAPHSLTALGLGTAGSSKTRPDGALSSPRRISTSHPFNSSAHRSQSPAPLGPTHEPYYSQTQPPIASTPRFRDREAYTQSQAGSPHHGHFLQPLGLHRRQQSNGSAMFAPTPDPSSPVGSVFKKLRRQASNIGFSIGKPDAYDDDARKDSDTEDDEPAQTINGTRVWYSSYVTIDWLHDAVRTLSQQLEYFRVSADHSDQRVLTRPPSTPCR